MGDLRDNYWFSVIRDELSYSEEYLNLFENPDDCINILLWAIMFIAENKGYPARITHYLEQIEKDYSFQKEYIAEKLELLINDLSLFEGITDKDIDQSMTNVFEWIRKNKYVSNQNEPENKRQHEEPNQSGIYYSEFYIADVREKIANLSPNEQIKYILAIKTRYRQTDFQMDNSGLFTIDTFEQGFIAKCDLEIEKIRETKKIDELAIVIGNQAIVHNNSPKESERKKEIKPIWWQGTGRQLGYLLDELAVKGFIDKNTNFNEAIKTHFIDKDKNPFKDSIKQNKSGTGQNKNQKPKGAEALDEILKKLPNKK